MTLDDGIGSGVTEFAPIPEARPIADPHVAKDQLLRGWKAIEGQFGLPVGGDQLERLATHDLTVYDAVRRDDGPPMPVNPETPDERRARHDEFAAKAAEEHRATVLHAPPKRPALVPALDLPPHLVSPRWPFALGRLRRILEGATPTINPVDCSIDWRATCSTCGDPRRAYEYMELKSNFDFRTVPQTERHNPFWGLSALDAGLKFQSEVERLCDRSTGKLGQWWVPK